MSRWTKNLMQDAGLEGFPIHSAWGSSATCAMLMGMPISEIVKRVGWTNDNTFIRNYLKPISTVSKAQIKQNVSKSVREVKQGKTIKDSHGIVKHWEKQLTRSTHIDSWQKRRERPVSIIEHKTKKAIKSAKNMEQVAIKDTTEETAVKSINSQSDGALVKATIAHTNDKNCTSSVNSSFSDQEQCTTTAATDLYLTYSSLTTSGTVVETPPARGPTDLTAI